MRRILTLLGLALVVCGTLSAQTLKPFRDWLAQSDLKTVYQKWLDEDVAYIITAQESRAFTSLKTDAEREQFIEAFWLRRDPNPETTENEYRAEHYERIAHANQNFGFNNRAGWRTDRGRIYIMYGKPDEVRTSASKEVWIYRYLPNTGSNIEIEFVDATGTGELRLRKPIQ
jgi:GWxTD domain-containing protein